MLASRAGLVETKWDEHRTNIYENHENLTLQVTIIYNSSDTRGISWIWCCGMLWVGFLPGSQLELAVSCQPWVTGCGAAPLPNGCLIVCGGSCNVFFSCFSSWHVKLWCCDGETSIDQLSSKIFQVFGVAGYDEQGIVRGILDSCEVLTVDVDGKSSDCGYMRVLLQFAPILHFRNANIWCYKVFDPVKQRWGKTGAVRIWEDGAVLFLVVAPWCAEKGPEIYALCSEALLRARWGHGSPGWVWDVWVGRAGA